MIGILGGTSFRETDVLRRGTIKRLVTPYGGVDVAFGDGVAMVSRHGVTGLTPPHRINHQAHLKALQLAGVSRIVAFGSVGGLKPAFGPGVQAVIDDFYAPHRVMTFHHESLHFTVPGYDPAWRSEVLQALRAAGLDVRDGGVYAETFGPRFETPAEVRALALHADVAGMTCASESTLAGEIGLPIAVIVTVDNYANGIGETPLTGEGFKLQVKVNHERVMRAFAAAVELGG